MVFAVNPTPEKTFEAFKAKATGTNTTSSSTGSVPSPSASNNPSNNAALGFGSSKLTGIISLVAILAGSVL